MNPLFVDKYVEKLKNLAAQRAAESSTPKAKSEWQEIVGEITTFLNEERVISNEKDGTTYPPLEAKRVAMMVAYIKDKGGLSDLRKFRDDVRSKGAWFFWYIVKPKKDPNQQRN
jgi:hypothetical protein